MILTDYTSLRVANKIYDILNLRTHRNLLAYLLDGISYREIAIVDESVRMMDVVDEIGFDFMQRSPNLTFIDVLNQLVTGVRTAVGASNMTADDPFFIFMKNFKIGRITLSNFDLARLLTGMLMDSGEVGDIFRRNRNGGREQQGGLGNFEIYAKSMLLNSKSIINDNQNSGKKRFGAEATDDSITSTRDMLDRHRRVNAEMYGDSAAIQGIMDTVANYRISMVSMFEGYLDAMPEFA